MPYEILKKNKPKHLLCRLNRNSLKRAVFLFPMMVLCLFVPLFCKYLIISISYLLYKV